MAVTDHVGTSANSVTAASGDIPGWDDNDNDVDNDVARRYRRAADYIAVAMIYLRDNVLLTEPLRTEHLKPRLLGHWGTCPGINFAYGGLNALVSRSGQRTLLVTGPGHGAPAIHANLWLEGTHADYDPALGRDAAGLAELAGRFSWPGGFPSHLSPEVPGVIHEGGELGYALACAFGAALDKPDLLVACLVGDGEAETGPTAAAWHCGKFLDPATSGAVLPILHLNGYKISSPTVYGTMADEELVAYFHGAGWSPYVLDVSTEDGPRHPHGLSDDDFTACFGAGDVPVVFGFHGYPSAIHEVLHGRADPSRFHVHGYLEEGTTTTPFDLLVSNRMSRYDLAADAVSRARGWSSRGGAIAEELRARRDELRARAYADGIDPDEITAWKWS